MSANSTHRSKILIVGAAGRTGRLLTATLVQNGHDVRAMTRNVATARSVLPPAADIVAGDLTRADDIIDAVAGVGAIIFIASAGAYADGRPQDIDFAGVARMVDAAIPQRVGHVVLVASASVTHPEHPHNCVFNSVLKWKFRGENYLRQSGLPYTIVRPLGLRDRAGHVHGIRVVQGDRLAFGEDISRDDVAAFLSEVISITIPYRLEDQRARPPFSTDLQLDSLIGSTVEIYNDSSIAAGTWCSKNRVLSKDG